jgi:hypothetical protein
MKVEPAVYRFPDNESRDRWGWCKLGEVTEIVNAYRSRRGEPELGALAVIEKYLHIVRSPGLVHFPQYLFVSPEGSIQVVGTEPGNIFGKPGYPYYVEDPNEVLVSGGWSRAVVEAARAST